MHDQLGSIHRPTSRKVALWLAFNLASLLAMSVRASDVGGCSEIYFRSAMAGAGLVTFTQDCAVTLTAPITVSSDTVIDTQGFNVSISGGGKVTVFVVQS